MLSLYRQLGHEIGGIYSAFLDLCYATAGPVEDNDKYIAGTLGLDVRVWKRVRRTLLLEERIYERWDGGPKLSSPIADIIIADGQRRYDNTVRAGQQSAIASAARKRQVADRSATAPQQEGESYSLNRRLEPSQNNNLASTGVGDPPQRKTDTSTKKKERSGSAASFVDILRKTDQPVLQDVLRRAKQLRADKVTR